MKRSIAILGWGSLIWDEDREFDRQHEVWQFDGPILALEFSRISSTRGCALTLVLDYMHGRPCTVAYALSRRQALEDAAADLRCREATTVNNIGIFSASGAQNMAKHPVALESIGTWATDKKIGYVVWTDLSSNFEEKSTASKAFSVPAAIEHIQSLDAQSKAAAAEYVWRAPNFVRTPARDALQSLPWFTRPT